MNKEEILKKIEELEEQLEYTDEEEEQLENQRRLARVAAKSMKIVIEEYEKEGFTKELAIELIKLGIGGNK